jgi:hypothetical protein
MQENVIEDASKQGSSWTQDTMELLNVFIMLESTG